MLANGHGRFGTVESMRDRYMMSTSGLLPTVLEDDAWPVADESAAYGAWSIQALEQADLPTAAPGPMNAPYSPPSGTVASAGTWQPMTPAVSRFTEFGFPARVPPPPPPAPRHMCQCVPCGISFATASELALHFRISSAHPSCPICSKGLEHQSALLQVCRPVDEARLSRSLISEPLALPHHTQG